MIPPALPEPEVVPVKSSAKDAAHASAKRDHRTALKAGAPRVPPGYFWNVLSEGGFSLCREVEPRFPGGITLSYVGELDANGNWTPIHGEQFNPLTVKPASARKSSASKSAEFRIPQPDPLPERSGSAPVKPKRKRPLKSSLQRSESGYLLTERSGPGFSLPGMLDIQWESNERGGVEAYFAPDGAIKRSDKTYLVYIGLRKLRDWREQGQEVLHRNVIAAVEKARSEKNL